VTEYPSLECRYCITQAHRAEREHQLEIDGLKEEIEALKVKLKCQDEFIDKILALIKPGKKGAPIMSGLMPPSSIPPPAAPKTAQTMIMADAPYHQ
jgi:hypothetical protein